MHNKCFESARRKNPYVLGRRINHHKGTRRAVLSLSLVAVLLYLVFKREGLHGLAAPLQIPMLLLIVGIALIPLWARIISYVRYESTLRNPTPNAQNL